MLVLIFIDLECKVGKYSIYEWDWGIYVEIIISSCLLSVRLISKKYVIKRV